MKSVHQNQNEKGKTVGRLLQIVLNRTEIELDRKKEELRLKAEQLAIQNQKLENQSLLLTQQKHANSAMFENFQQ